MSTCEDSNGSQLPEPERVTKVNRDRDGEPIGIAAFITASELERLGIDPEDVDRVGISVGSNGIELQPVFG